MSALEQFLAWSYTYVIELTFVLGILGGIAGVAMAMKFNPPMDRYFMIDVFTEEIFDPLGLLPLNISRKIFTSGGAAPTFDDLSNLPMDEYGRTALHVAVASSDIETISRIWDQYSTEQQFAMLNAVPGSGQMILLR